jgi:hypothetical protein
MLRYPWRGCGGNIGDDAGTGEVVGFFGGKKSSGHSDPGYEPHIRITRVTIQLPILFGLYGNCQGGRVLLRQMPSDGVSVPRSDHG